MRNCTHEGGPASRMPWTNGTGSDVVAGQVVIAGHLLGIAAVNIANGAVGTIDTEGVFSVVKTTGAAWAQGDRVLWDVSASKFADSGATPATGDLINGAVAWVAALSADATGVIKLTPGGGSVAGAAGNETSITNLNAWATALATKLNADAGVTDTNYDTNPQA